MPPAGMKDGHNVRMLDARQCLHLAFEPLADVELVAPAGIDKLERDHAFCFEMNRAIDRCHRSATDELLDTIARDGRILGRFRGCRRRAFRVFGAREKSECCRAGRRALRECMSG